MAGWRNLRPWRKITEEGKPRLRLMNVTERERTEAQRRPSSPPPRGRRGYLLAGALVIGFLIAAIVGIVSRFAERRALARETETLAVPVVAVIHPRTESPQQSLVLPSTLQAYTESPIYARTNGYLTKWYRDIGSRVRTGELLA